MDPLDLIEKYYDRSSTAYGILVAHAEAVTRKSLAIAERMKDATPDRAFLEEAAMLHDIGVIRTNQPGIGCHGDAPYICHGYLGREILEGEGLPRHALVCERHVGVGITREEIDRNALPIPRRDMLPLTIEEKIICYADKFFSKKRNALHEEKTLEKVRRDILRYGGEALRRFEELHSFINR